MDLASIFDVNRFQWESETLGSILVHGLTCINTTTLSTRFLKGSETDSKKLIKELMLLTCQLDPNNVGEYNKERIAAKDVNTLSSKEISSFAEKFLQKNSYLKYDKTKEIKGGDKVTYEEFEDSELQQNESYCDLLSRLLKRYFENQYQRLLKSLDNSSIFSDEISSLLKETNRLRETFNHKIDSPEISAIASIPSIEIPENPIHNTNKKLDKLNDSIFDLASLVTNVNEIAVRMSLESADSAREADKQNKKSIKIALFALVVSVLFSAVGLGLNLFDRYSSNKSTEEVIRILAEISLNHKDFIVQQKIENEVNNKQLDNYKVILQSNAELLNKINQLDVNSVKKIKDKS